MSIGLHNRPFYSFFMNTNEKEQGISHLAPVGYMLFSSPNWNWSVYLLSAELGFDFNLSTKPVSKEDTNAIVACVANIPYSSLP